MFRTMTLHFWDENELDALFQQGVNETGRGGILFRNFRQHPRPPRRERVCSVFLGTGVL